jgi:hypothetical protein
LRQVDEHFDRSAPELSPNPLVFLPYLVFSRVRGPVDANAPEVFEGHLNSALAAIQGSVKLRLQACDGGIVNEVRSTAR